MRPPWAELAFTLHTIALFLLIAGFHWNAWVPAHTGPSKRSLSTTRIPPTLPSELQRAAIILEVVRITLTSALAVFVTALCVLFMHLIKCIWWPASAMVFFILSTVFGVALLVTRLVLSLVAVRPVTTGGSRDLTYGFYMAWAAVGTYLLAAAYGNLERCFPRPADPDRAPITMYVDGEDDDVYRAVF